MATSTRRRVPSVRNEPSLSQDKVKIDLEELEKTVKILRKNADVPIKNLTKDLREQFEYLLSTVGLLFESPSYEILYNMVVENFSDLEVIIPKTIGAFCTGCHPTKDGSKRDMIQNGCIPVCAGSMPPSSENWARCQNTVILATYDHGYAFNVLNSGEDEETRAIAYIYVKCKDMDSFHGFSDEEKSHLGQFGVLNVHLNGYTDDGKEYVELSKEPMLLNSIKTREPIQEVAIEPEVEEMLDEKEPENVEDSKTKNGPLFQKIGKNGWGVMMSVIISIILLIIIGISLIWGYSKSKRNTKSKA